MHLLATPGFLAGLLLLLANDFILKAQFHNGLTGKLSDFAGLFVFPLFWAAFFPRRESLIYASTAVLFVFWKSAYSQPLIEGWNSLPFFQIARTVDGGDLLALIMLPLSHAYSRLPPGRHPPRPATYAIAVVSMFAFTATQFSQKVSYADEYRFPFPGKELTERMRRLPANDVLTPFEGADTFEIHFDSCTGGATVAVREAENQSVVTLKEIEYRCPSEAGRQEMREYFEREFIAKLREEPVMKSSRVLYIWPSLQPTPSPSDNGLQPTPGQHSPRSSSPRRGD